MSGTTTTEPGASSTSNATSGPMESTSSMSRQATSVHLPTPSNTNPPDILPHCANCNQSPQSISVATGEDEDSTTVPSLKSCSKCHSVNYCSRECQKADMKRHKKVCAQLAQAYSLTADFKPAATRPPPKDGHRRGLQKWQFDT